MKKYALLMLIVLGMSTAAWAGPWACVDAPACVCSDECVNINVGACIPGRFCGDPYVKWCVKGNLVLVDIYLVRYDECHDSLKLCEPVCLENLCPGNYSVVARIYVKDVGPCAFPGRSVLTAMGSTRFTVKCCDPCCSPWPWWF